MQNQRFPNRALTDREWNLFENIADSVTKYYAAQQEILEAALAKAEEAAEDGEDPSDTERIDRINAFLMGPSDEVNAFRKDHPDEFQAMLNAWHAAAAESERRHAPIRELQSALAEIDTDRDCDESRTMLIVGVNLGLRDGAKLVMRHLLPQLTAAGLNVTLTPEIITLLSDDDAGVFPVAPAEGGAEE